MGFLNIVRLSPPILYTYFQLRFISSDQITVPDRGTFSLSLSYIQRDFAVFDNPRDGFLEHGVLPLYILST